MAIDRLHHRLLTFARRRPHRAIAARLAAAGALQDPNPLLQLTAEERARTR
jgi:hypothetical protein